MRSVLRASLIGASKFGAAVWRCSLRSFAQPIVLRSPVLFGSVDQRKIFGHAALRRPVRRAQMIG